MSDIKSGMDLQKPPIVVGIGASAGGLEALKLLLSDLPNDTNACFVVVQHLSPDYKSMMGELLQKHTSMPVNDLSDGDSVKPNTILVLPAKKEVELKDGKFLLSQKVLKPTVSYTIDKFLKSLADDQKENAIGVVLSGTGSDGSVGLRSIKELGGFAIAQTPESAKFDGMPNSAISTGIVDLVLPPQKIGTQLKRYINHTHQFEHSADNDNDSSENQEVLNEIFKLIRSESEIDFNRYKHTTLLRRIHRRMKINYVQNLSEYLTILIKDKNEVSVLRREFLIGVTHFFRDTQAFDVMRETVIPDLVAKTAGSMPLRVWISACSTGEECYSLAILLKEEMEKQGKDNEIKIYATDVNSDAIERASAGMFSKIIEEEVPEQYLNRYFNRSKDGNYKITERIRSLIVFATHDLLMDPPFSKLSLVTCRNVLIYFQADAQNRIMSRLFYSLNVDGYLFLGPSENLGKLGDKFDVISSKYRIFKKTSNERILDATVGESEGKTKLQVGAPDLPSVNSLLQNYRRPLDSHVNGFANESLIKQFVSPCILLDEELSAVHVYGDVSPYVKRMAPGRISSHISDMINEDLAIALNTAIKKAKEKNGVVKLTSLQTAHDGGQRGFDLVVSYIKEHNVSSMNGFYWVVFESSTEIEHVDIEKFDPVEQAKQRITDLENELKSNKEHLQVSVEELETTNEELQSANEELMSANEELQSTNEELQSVNEELYTVNSEYQEKISEISQANNDLDKVLDLSEIGIVFLNEDLHIRRYTDAAQRYINVLETDIDRPLFHISHNIDYEDLLKDAARVAKESIKVEKEVKMDNRQIAKVAIYPYNYKDLANTKGVVITFTDITHARNSEQGMLLAYRQLQSTLDVTLNNVDKLSKDKQINVLVVDDNDSYLEIFLHELSTITSLNIKAQIAKSVDQALVILKTQQIDICLCDYYLQKSTALDLVAQLKVLEQDIPFLVMTGQADDELVPMLFSNGIFDLVEKDDLDAEKLTRRISNALKRHSLQNAQN